jgi:signal transduction histidine kinase
MKGFCRELSKKCKVEIHFSHTDVPEIMSADISLCLFRVLQEALHNAVKHSGVHRFDVNLYGTSDEVSLTIRDSGVGFEAKTAMKGSGLGLISMQERLKLVNGELSIDSQRKRGTEIRARVPFVPDKTLAPAAT